MLSTPMILISALAVATVAASSNVTDTFEDQAPFQALNGNNCFYVKGMDHPGFDVGNKPAQEYRQCNDLCKNFRGCATWAWSNYNGGTCWLKSYISGFTKTDGVVSLDCLMYKEDPPRVCSWYEGVDFVGNDIGSKKGYHWDCCVMCEQTQGCSAYSWNDYEGGTCYFKSSVGQVISKAGVFSSSTKMLDGPVCPFEYDTDFVGNDIANKLAKDAGACCSMCKGKKDCNAYSWSNYQGGTCWMKSGKGQAIKAAGVISAALFLPPRY